MEGLEKFRKNEEEVKNLIEKAREVIIMLNNLIKSLKA